MTNRTRKGLTTPITYYGGKQKMVRHILPLIPKHSLYCEPFVGGGAVFWAKEPSAVEVINDLNQHVVNFYRICQREFGMLRVMIQSTPHSRAMHREAGRMLDYPEQYSALSRAWAFWVQVTQGFSGQIGKGFGYERKTNKTSLKIHHKRNRFGREFKDRLNLVQIECNDALTVIKSRDCEGAFFYIDPPYFNSDCGHYSGYSEADFRALLDLLCNIKGRFLLSSYPSDLLKEYADKMSWKEKRFQAAVAVTQHTKKQKVEVLTANYQI